MRLFVVALLLPFSFMAQTHVLKGLILDADNNEPVAFVAVHIPDSKVTVLSDIDGRFSISFPAVIQQLVLSHVSYFPLNFPVKPGETEIVIRLRPRINAFDEVVITPGENPAHRIIRKVMENSEKNDPYALKSFRCETYSKMFITGEFPVDTNSTIPDSLKKTRKYFEKQHFFITETVTEKVFKSPSKENEKVLGSKVSGFKMAPFFTPVTQLQSFGFYKPFISILDKDYVNPLASGTFNRYQFLLEDTLLTPDGDSIFLVSFHPRKGRNFEAMQGVLYIHSENYALYRVIAEPVDITGVISAHIEQEYEKVMGMWFPKVLNTDWYYNNMKVTDSTIIASTRNFSERSENKMKVVCCSRISNVEINPNLASYTFISDAVFAEKGHDDRDSEWWKSKRKDSLTGKDVVTYQKIDSIGKAQHFDRKMTVIEALSTGCIPMGPIELELPHLFRMNEVEKARIGIGLSSSRKLSREWKIGAYVAYGSLDKRIKYGGRAGYYGSGEHEFTFATHYINDLEEPGKTDWMEPKKGLDGSSVREYNIPWMQWKEMIGWNSSIRFNEHWKLYASIDQFSVLPDSGIIIMNSTNLLVNSPGISGIQSVVQIRWQQNEKFINTRFGRNSLGSRWPAVYLRWSGVSGEPVVELEKPSGSLWNGQWNKYECRIEWKWKTKAKGTSFFRLEGGTMNGSVSMTNAFIPNGSYVEFGHFAEGTFENMRYNEFASTHYLSLFHKHDFGKISRKNRFNPSIAIVNNYHWGKIDGTLYPTPGIQPIAPEKIYMESGLQINGLVRNQFIGIGIQGMYRYGAYTFSQPTDNYTIKSTLKIVF